METSTNQLRAILAAVLRFIVALPSFAYDFEVNCIFYTVLDETAKTVEVTFGDNRYSGPITIPPSVSHNGISYSVTSIGKKAFSWCDDLIDITIPNSVTEIGEGAFWCCAGLTSITIPNSVTEIGDFAFYDCSGLTSINIPNSVTTIGDGAFSGCTGLTSITIPNSVTSIGNYAFFGCDGLKTIIIQNPDVEFDIYPIPEGVEVIIEK